jgi:hypothetical protein
MKKIIKKTIGFLILVISMQLLTASTGKNSCLPVKTPTAVTKKVKLKKATRITAQIPLFESLLKHF